MLLTIREAAEQLRVSQSKLYEMVAKNRIGYFRDGTGPIRFDEVRHIQAYLESIEHGRGETWPVERKPQPKLRYLRG